MSVSSERKKILVLNGSPHRARSTTMVAANAFLHGMTDEGDYTVETITVSDLKITPCSGCLSCWGRTPGECSIHGDDIDSLREKILAADVIVSAFPLYFFGMPGEMKVMLDRLLPFISTYRGQSAPHSRAAAHTFRQPLGNKQFLLFCSCAFTDGEEVCEPMLRQFDLILGHERYTPIICPQLRSVVDAGGSRLQRTFARLDAAGHEYAATGALSEATLKGLCKPPFSPLVYRTLMNGMWAEQEEIGRAMRARKAKTAKADGV